MGQKFTPPFLFHHPDNQQTLKLHTFRAMKIKTTLCLIALTLAPTFALAGPGCDREKMNISASSCVEGTVYDAATGVCVPQTTS